MKISLEEATIMALSGKLTEDYQMQIDEKGLPVLERPYVFKEDKTGTYYYIDSIHPYDETIYSRAISNSHDIDGRWSVYDQNPNYYEYINNNEKPYKIIKVVTGWQEAYELMQELDKNKKARIDKW